MNLPATIATQLNGEVAPAVAAAIADDDTVRDAAAVALDGVVDLRLGRVVGQRTTPFSEAQRVRWRREPHKKIPGPTPGQELVLHQRAGAGMGLRYWLAVALAGAPGNSYPNYDLRVRVYFDGESTPSIDADVAVFLGYLNSSLIGPGSISTDHFAAISNGRGLTGNSGWNRLLMPYRNGMKITIANTTNAGPSFIYSQLDTASVADNPTMVIPDYRLALKGDSGNAQRGVNPDADATLHTLTGAGFLAAHLLVGRSAEGGGFTYLERKVQVFVDGEQTPSIESSGTEDWFDSSFYYDSDSPFSRQGSMGFGRQKHTLNGTPEGPRDPQTGVQTDPPVPYASHQFVDLLSQGQAIEFENGLVMRWVRAVDLVDYAGYASAVWYYRRVAPADGLTDDFERPDTSAGLAATGRPWRDGASVGTWGVAGGEAYNATATFDGRILIDAESVDQDIEVTVGTSAGNNAGIMFGAGNETNGYIFNFSSRGLFKIVGGNISPVPNTPDGTPAVPGDVFRIVRKGVTFKVFQNGQQVGSYADDSTITDGTLAGLFSPAGLARFASFSVRPA